MSTDSKTKNPNGPFWLYCLKNPKDPLMFLLLLVLLATACLSEELRQTASGAMIGVITVRLIDNYAIPFFRKIGDEYESNQ